MNDLRASIVSTAQAMDRAGFAPSKSGNVSARVADGMLITPSGLPYAGMTPGDLVRLSLDGVVVDGQDTSNGPSTPRSTLRGRMCRPSSIRTAHAPQRSPVRGEGFRLSTT
jgi:ribulose-5-phosphate 4-epimerase/fuculose-1-phosphate aldolase